MAGAIIENIRTRNLMIVGAVLLLFQMIAFMVGAFTVPYRTTAVYYVFTKCVDQGKSRESTWFMPWGPEQCNKIQTFDEEMATKIEWNNIVFTTHIPMNTKEMSPWFQSMLLILQFDISVKKNTQIEKDLMATMEVGLAYRDDTVNEWTPMVRSFEQRKFNCNFVEAKISEKGGRYECDLLPFMEISSVAHKYYLLNIRLPVNEHKKINTGFGHVNNMYLALIRQNGHFTKMWFSMKTFFTPIIIIALVWYWRRIMVMSRPPLLLEKAILALGISMTFINIPVEWFCVSFSWLHLLVDIRQDVFYCMLLSFWIIFCGEHIMDKTKRNHLSVYWKQVGLVVFGCLCLLIFHIYERVIQISHRVKSIWTSDGGAELSIIFITVSGTGACLYFLFLVCFMVLPGFCCTSSKKVSLPDKSTDRCLRYKGLRFLVLVLVTVICAALTVIFFIISQVVKLKIYLGMFTVQVNNAFFIGIYSMWNLYVLATMFLYAPSH